MDKNSSSKLVVGFVLFGESTFRYLPYFLESLKKQSQQSFKMITFDNSVDITANRDFVVNNYPEVEIIASDNNVGFGAAHNEMIRKAVNSGVKYYLAINPDTMLEPDALQEMITVMDGEDDLASASPRILQWDFANNKKTDIIDTCGIELGIGLLFRDAKQGKHTADIKSTPNIIGPSGACALYRVSSLMAVKEGENFFDENMFMYKEDCDLAYRLFLAGFKSASIDTAIVYHDRTASGMNDFFHNRKSKGENINTWSLKNQLIIFYKFWGKQGMFSKLFIISWKIAAFFYIIIFERKLLRYLLTNIGNKGNIVRYE